MKTEIQNKQNIPTLHPDFEALREEESRLRAELTVLLLQKDDLQNVQSRRIESAYLRRFGSLELKIYEAYCACLREKRKATMIRASINRREDIDLPTVEAALDRELESYRETLRDKMDQMIRVMNNRESGSGLTTAGREELKKLYRNVVKALHPDLHPETSEREQKLLQRAMEAYRFGDLKALRAVSEAADASDCHETEGSFEVLQAEIRRLKASVRALNAELEEIKKAYPFNLRGYLEDPRQADERRSALEEKLRSLRSRKAEYEARIREMLAPEEMD